MWYFFAWLHVDPLAGTFLIHVPFASVIHWKGWVQSLEPKPDLSFFGVLKLDRFLSSNDPIRLLRLRACLLLAMLLILRNIPTNGSFRLGIVRLLFRKPNYYQRIDPLGIARVAHCHISLLVRIENCSLCSLIKNTWWRSSCEKRRICLQQHATILFLYCLKCFTSFFKRFTTSHLGVCVHP